MTEVMGAGSPRRPTATGGGIRRVVATVVLTAGLFVAHVQSIGFLATGVAALLGLLLVPGLGAFLVAWGRFRRRRASVAWGSNLLLAAVVAFLASAVTTQAQRAESMARGDAVCAALDDYRAARGEYPEALDALVPDFLAAVPSSCMGLFETLPLFYERKGDGDHRLWFASTAFALCSRGPQGPWRCDD